MYPFPSLEPVCCSLSSSNCCFLTCIQVSQEAGQVVWYSHLFQNFPQFIVIHTVKGFGIVNKAEIDVFLELSFLMIQRMLAIWSLVPLPFLKPVWTSGSSRFTYCWSLAWRILSTTSLAWDECNCVVVWAFFGIAFLRDWNENWPFPVLWPLLSFQICWHIECSIFTASSFRIWNSSTEIPSPSLALWCLVMLPKAHLTSHSRMMTPGDWWHQVIIRWVMTPSWLSGSWGCFLYSSSEYTCHLFLISSASLRSIPFLSFIEPIFAWNVHLVSLIFLKRSLVFPILLSSSISLHWSLRKAFLSLLANL